MHYVHIVAMVSILQYIFFAVLVGRARGAYGVKAPAVVGHEMFERAYRVQMNTLELLVAFIPALYVAAHYWAPAIVAGVGAVYVIGRFIYWRAYVADPSSRQLGFLFSILPVMGLALASLVPAVIAVTR